MASLRSTGRLYETKRVDVARLAHAVELQVGHIMQVLRVRIYARLQIQDWVQNTQLVNRMDTKVNGKKEQTWYVLQTHGQDIVWFLGSNL